MSLVYAQTSVSATTRIKQSPPFSHSKSISKATTSSLVPTTSTHLTIQATSESTTTKQPHATTASSTPLSNFRTIPEIA